MLISRKLLAIAIVVALFGCKSEVSTASSSASGSSESSPGPSAAPGAPATTSGGTQKVEITDPSLNMNAYDVVIPANWHFQSTLMQGGQCVPTPFPVFRTTSPDGLSSIERQPTMGWRWGTGPVATAAQTDCLPLKAEISAQDFLKYLAGTMNVTYAGDAPVPASDNAQAQQGLAAAEASVAPKYAASHLTPPKSTRQLARAYVTFNNGSFAMKGELRAQMDCTETIYPGMKSILRGIPDRPDSDVHQCTASALYIATPQNNFDAVVKQWDAPGMGAKGLDTWQQAWIQRNQQQANQAMAQMRANTQAAMQASAQKFQHDMAVQSQMHQQFLATMQRGTDMSMAATQQSMNARSTATSDWVDYALDQKTVMDPGTGQLSKVSNASSYTWVDSSGKTSYQTNDVNANPNGVLQGNWTKQQTVHGDGTR